MARKKKWYTSKTLWVNAVSILAIVLQGVSGKEVISVEAQAAILGLANLILRSVTKDEIDWK